MRLYLYRGYTLVEMVVVVGIMALLITGGAVSFRGFNQQQKVLQARENLVVFLSDAKKMAEVGVASYCQGNALAGVRVVTDAIRVRLFAICSPTLTPYPTISGEFILPSGLEFDPLPGHFHFLTLSRGISDGVDRTFTVRDTSNHSVTATVVVTLGGQVK